MVRNIFAMNGCTTEVISSGVSRKGYEFVSQTDTEVIAHLIHSLYRGDLFAAVRDAVDPARKFASLQSRRLGL